MMSALKSKMRFALAFGLAGLGAGCSTMESMIPSQTPGADSPRSGGISSGQGPDSPGDKVVRLPMAAEDLDCPTVEIEDGASTARVGGPANSAVRYQFDITDTSRECEPRGSQWSLKVGVAGRLLIGPAGSPGAYSNSVKVLVRREVDQKTVFQKSYRVEASTAGGVQAPFQVVTEEILFPYTRTELNDDYSIFVGFDNGRNVAIERPRHHRKPKPVDATTDAH